MKLNQNTHITKDGILKRNPLPKKVEGILHFCIFQVNELGDDSKRTKEYYRNEALIRELSKYLKNPEKYIYVCQQLFDKYTELSPEKIYDEVAVDILTEKYAGGDVFYDVTPKEAIRMSTEKINNPSNDHYYSKEIKRIRAFRKTPDKIE